MTPEEVHTFLMNNVTLALVFTAVSVVVSWIAYIRGFFVLPYATFKGPDVKFYDAVAGFGIFVAVYLFVTPALLWFFSSFIKMETHRPLYVTLLQLTIFSFTALFLFLYSFFRDRKAMKKIWRDSTLPKANSLQDDLIMAWLTLVVASPVVLAVAHIAEVLRIWLFGYSQVEQLAIRYLKLAFSSPSALISAIFTILILAPALEEYLFRGLLQSWLRNKLGPVKAIFVTALFFGLFHFSTVQSSTNIPLIMTLTAFSCYLGFLYEKTRSLFAPIFLHVTFNCISVIRIIFTEV